MPKLPDKPKPVCVACLGKNINALGDPCPHCDGGLKVLYFSTIRAAELVNDTSEAVAPVRKRIAF